MILTYCLVIFTHVRKVDRVANERAQRMFTRNLLGFPSSLSQGVRGWPLGLNALWLCQFILNLAFPFNLCHYGVRFTINVIHFAGSPPCPLTTLKYP